MGYKRYGRVGMVPFCLLLFLYVLTPGGRQTGIPVYQVLKGVMADDVKRHENYVESHELSDVAHQLSKQLHVKHCWFQIRLAQ